jgi:DNA-binding NarL/FixJ family response regulator
METVTNSTYPIVVKSGARSTRALFAVTQGVIMSGVLIVENDEKFRRRLKSFLSMRFPSVDFEEVADGKEALGKINTFRPAVVFMDIRLPGKNGLEWTEKIKELFPATSIAILTTYDFPEYRDAAYQRGADAFLVKGRVTMVEIAKLLDSVLTRKSALAGIND